MVSVEDTGLRGGGFTLKQHIWDAARDTIQEWTGQELTQVRSIKGIPHRKRRSCMIVDCTRIVLTLKCTHVTVFFVRNSCVQGRCHLGHSCRPLAFG